MLRGAVAVCVLAFAAWAACVAGYADPFLRVLIVGIPLVLASVAVCLHAAFRRRRWWALLAVAAALWAYAPVAILFALKLGI